MELVVEELVCRRGGRAVFGPLSFAVRAGRALWVRGPNGAGKSSLLRLLAGLGRAESGGAVLVAAGDTLRLGDSGWQERVAFAGHLDAVKPALGVAENLALWQGLSGSDGGAVDAVLTRFGLDRIARRPAAECSAGQKRRLGLARLLLANRPLWLLDEPTVSLDIDATALVADLVRAHCAAGGIAVLTSHTDLGLPEAEKLNLSAAMSGRSALENQSAGQAFPASAATADDPFLEGRW
ncbi:MAG: heme ABC exporter ATP-binding protein CcmA [Pseudomonadota bacterium]